MIMGDLNARVKGDQQQILNRCVGPFTVDEVNENGTKLMDFCMINNLVISNAFIQHKLTHKTSWMHPGSKIWVYA